MAYLGDRNELARRRLTAYGRPGLSTAISGDTAEFNALKQALSVRWPGSLQYISIN